MPADDRASWALMGEGIVAFTHEPHRVRSTIPPGLSRLPGPVVVLAESFTDSPVGPFLSLSIGEPVRLGVRPGYYFGLSVLNSADARRLGRQYWGFPHELGNLRWWNEDEVRCFSWEERGIELRASGSSRPLPVLFPMRSLQHRTDRTVVVPTRLRALARRTTVEFVADEDDPLKALAGKHFGFVLSGMLLRRNPARRGYGIFSTLRAPLRVPEPRVIGMNGPLVSFPRRT